MNNEPNLEFLATEATSLHQDLENKSINDLLLGINEEDRKVAFAVEKSIPQIEALIAAILPKMQKGGRVFYIGAGTSGRLGILDASECPPTYGIPQGVIVGLIAGGETAIRSAVEHAEDDPLQAWNDLQEFNPTVNDTVIGIAASGRTPYVIGGVKRANENGLLSGCLVCNHNSVLSQVAQFPIEIVVGPEFVTGSTRMKAGTAQKMVLNMISTTLMIKLGRVKGNKMVDMQLSNQKLVERGARLIMKETGLDFIASKALLLQTGGVRKALESFQK